MVLPVLLGASLVLALGCGPGDAPGSSGAEVGVGLFDGVGRGPGGVPQANAVSARAIVVVCFMMSISSELADVTGSRRMS